MNCHQMSCKNIQETINLNNINNCSNNSTSSTVCRVQCSMQNLIVDLYNNYIQCNSIEKLFVFINCSQTIYTYNVSIKCKYICDFEPLVCNSVKYYIYTCLLLNTESDKNVLHFNRQKQLNDTNIVTYDPNGSRDETLL